MRIWKLNKKLTKMKLKWACSQNTIIVRQLKELKKPVKEGEGRNWSRQLFSHLVVSYCEPVDSSTPGFPVLHDLWEFAQTHVLWVGDAIQPSHPVAPFSCPQSFPASGSFPVSWFFTSGGQRLGASASASELPVNRVHLPQDWLVCSPCSPRDSQEFSPTPQFKSINSWVLCLLHGPALTSVPDN